MKSPWVHPKSVSDAVSICAKGEVLMHDAAMDFGSKRKWNKVFTHRLTCKVCGKDLW